MLKLYENIRNFRLEKGWSQDELARRAGYTDRSSIAKIESGKVDLPQKKIERFASALGVSPAELMGWTEIPQPRAEETQVQAEKPADHTEPASNLQPYYFDPETAAIAQEIHDNRQMQILFDAARDATPEQLRAVQALIRGFKEDAEGGRDDGNQGGWTE